MGQYEKQTQEGGIKLTDQSDFHSSVRLKGNKINSNNEFVSYIYFRGVKPSNVILKEIPTDIKNPVWNSKSKSWINKGGN